MAEGKSFMGNVLAWIHDGYPDGVPQKDYFPLLALLKRTLTEEEVVEAARTILRGNDSESVTADEIRAAIEEVTSNTEPTVDEVHQVAARLASVGWPLAAPLR